MFKLNQRLYSPANLGTGISGEKGFQLTPLPYTYDSLEPSIEKETVTIHHDKHQQAYVDKLNTAIKGNAELYNKDLNTLLTSLNTIQNPHVKTQVTNNAGGVYNHEFYWSVLHKPESSLNEPIGNLKASIERDFGTIEEFKTKFTDASIKAFASAWVWLVTNSNGTLSIVTLPNQICPITDGLTPVLTIDLWEHAYYLGYQNRRPEYIQNYWKIVNWNKCEEYYNNR